MALSHITAVPFIAERSEATPGLWNNIISVISQNFDTLNSAVSLYVLSGTLNAASFPGATSDAQIQAAINSASTSGISRVYVSQALSSYNGSLVSFIGSVQMVREGGDWSVYDVSAYGIRPGTVDTNSLQTVENLRPYNAVLFFPSGRYIVDATYDGSVAAAARLLSITTSGSWDFSDAVLQYGAAVNLTVGSDGGGLGVLNIRADDVTLQGALDGNNLARYPLTIQGQRKNVYFPRLSIRSTLTASGVWPGIQFATSVDVTGTAIGGTRATNVAGLLARPNCPMMDTSNSITTFRDVTALILGGTEIVDNATSAALVMNSAAWNVWLHTLGQVGVRTSPKLNESNVPLMDLVVHDLGHNTAECYGNPANAATAYGLGTGEIVGHLIKGGTHSGWYHYNVQSTSTLLPNVDITAGSSASAARVSVQGTYFASDGTASSPHFAFSSETSLGLYRSGVSTLALSYGTLLIEPGSGSGNLILRALTTGNSEIRKSAGQLQIIDAGAIVLTTTGAGNHLFFQTNASGTNRVIIRSGGTIDVAQPLLTASGSAVAPSYGYSSEFSLGWYRSATSTVALSYGTLDLTAAVLSISSLNVKSGTNNSCGTAVLGSNGSVNVANTYVAAGDLIFLTDQTAGGTLGDIELGGIRAGSGFTVLSTSITDTSTVAWLIVRPS